MSYKPAYIVFDYETGEVQSDGSTRASTEAYRKEFRVLSCAFGWLGEDGGLRTVYTRGEHETGEYLEKVVNAEIPLVAHNIQFEKLVTKCRYPDTYSKIKWHADTMRLVQNFDNGGDDQFLQEQIYTDLDDMLLAIESGEDVVKTIPLGGLGLVKAAKRILNAEDHKKEAYEWIRANVSEWSKGKKEGMFLDRLPDDILERYNVADVEVTLKLYEFITEAFRKEKFDWTLDHDLFLGTVEFLVDAKIRGVPVNREALSNYIVEVQTEFDAIGHQFIAALKEPIKEVERIRLLKRIRKLKTLKGRKKYLKRIKAQDPRALKEIRFNPGSNGKLETLFCEVLGMEAKFRTSPSKKHPQGQPSFRSAVLGQWGEHGTVLLKRRKRLIVLKQCQSLLELTKYDGRFHIDLKACGTSTSRFAGGNHL